MDGSAQYTDANIDFTVTMPAGAGRVFDAITKPDDLNVWAWGGIGREPKAEIDLRPGGLYALSVVVEKSEDWPSTTWAMRGVYVEIDPPRRLVYSVHWDAPVFYNQGGKKPIDEVVAIDLTPRGDETELHYVHVGVPGAEAASAHERAIKHTFAMLAEHLAKG